MDAQLSENSSSFGGPLSARLLNEFAYCSLLAYLESGAGVAATECRAEARSGKKERIL
jgi:hypothetical protein